ncbi:tryptophan halogenase family protein [Asticcacaulis sp.]|uniref:tryptophan halogenase family protein n=1 Tax=Asticcacaulis sp. TaxID=1872648 RepID=UPI002BEB35EC|nr:tryptophan halogenase family protein [Asticcacaulis sp.]HTM82287.1 tryptophan halogenase family protein [Asticcacaulis sp.]
MVPPIKEIVIVGGGSAGWMTAAALSSLLAPKDVTITLVESDEIGIIGVGEATIPDLLNFNRMLGIDEADFIRATNATFKLGIEFIDWGRKGDRYIHPFSNHGVDMNGFDFHQFWLHSRAAGNPYPIDDYSLCAIAARQGKFTHPDPNPRAIRSHIRYAYHFDASLYARYLRAYAEKRGVRRIEGKVQTVIQTPETGRIAEVKLEDGRSVDGEFFFDCSGFRSLLLGQTLGVRFNDWSHWLPCNSAQAVPSSHAGPLPPFTRATAKASGWQWRIPTQARTGNGHIYCRDFISDDEAASVLLAGLDSEALASPRIIRFTAGHRQTFWEKNCIAIGLAAGFLEPLESTSIYLIQEGISRFISLFPNAALPEVFRHEYNRHMRTEFEQVRDFIILHFTATERTDSPFWDYCRNMPIPDSLEHKIALFREGGRAFRCEDELFSRPSWVAVFLGQNIIPKAYDPVVATLPPPEVTASVESMRVAMIDAVSQMPTHEDYLARYSGPAAG